MALGSSTLEEHADAAPAQPGRGDGRAAPAETRQPSSAGARLHPSHVGAVTAAKTALRRRRMRDRAFPGDLFTDPSWDIMLDLFVAGMEGRQVSVSGACVAASAPMSTALRHLKRLEQERHIERRDDPRDLRRNFVRLTPDAHAKMLALFASPKRAERSAS